MEILFYLFCRLYSNCSQATTKLNVVILKPNFATFVYGTRCRTVREYTRRYALSFRSHITRASLCDAAVVDSSQLDAKHVVVSRTDAA